ncbi:hypothetical protein LPJ53_004947 [Coemansia erecta]|uniref:SGNH hydrolase n=1 Tax=Coemansia erecta TaxID=147472 RepID=A0A9W7XTE0_9FUNG|nr:hypothetical protein LPJ53_004947 [Coemansia erecta]
MPPPIYWNGRFSSGPVWNEYLSLLMGYNLDNHAVGMAKSETIHRTILNFIPLDPPTTEDQIAEFAALNSQSAIPLIAPMDIAVLEIGANDLNTALIDVSFGEQTVYEFVQDLSDIVLEQLQSLKDIGFKRILVTNLPSLQNAPVVKTKNRTEVAEVAVSTYNRILKQKTDSWIQTANLDIFDIIDLGGFTDVAMQPAVTSAIGITDTETYCVGGSWITLFQDQLLLGNFMKYLFSSDSLSASCSDPGTKFFFDPIHPSERVHRLFAYHIHETVSLLISDKDAASYELSESGLVQLIETYKLNEPAPKPAAI